MAPAERFPRGEEVTVTVYLRRGGGGGALPEPERWSSPRLASRTYWARAEFGRRFTADAGDLETVRRWADVAGLTVGRVDPARRAVALSAESSAVARSFGTRLRPVRLGGRSYHEAVGRVRLPSGVSDAIRAVVGLTDRPLLRPHFRLNPRAAAGYSIPTVGDAYGFPPGSSGSGVTIGVLEFGGGYQPADLTAYFEGLGRPVPSVVSVSVDGAENAPTGDPSGPDAEVELDVEMAGALAPGAKIVVYFAPNTEQGFANALTTAIHDGTHQPSIVSISWGGPEPSWSASARAALELACQDAAALGVTVLAASGDQGATDGEPAGDLTVDFPASSPYVLACGGTRLVLSGAVVAAETVWNDLAQGEGATGGGVSEEFPLPSFQAGSAVPKAPNGYAGRGVPDVAADADPETGYSVVVDGAAAVIGGTSAVAPLWAALLARLQQSLGKPLGFANPLLYAPSAAAGFRPITSGGNGGYSAGPGWNPCTGLGSPKGATLLGALGG